MSAAHRPWLPTGSTLSPMILQLRLENSGSRPAIYPSSVVQTGVKSFGCENRTAQPSPIQSWKSIVPCVVSAVKFGLVSLIRRDIGPLLRVYGRRMGRSERDGVLRGNRQSVRAD